MPALTEVQQLALKRLSDADDDYRQMKRYAESIVRAEVHERIEKYKHKRDLRAFEAKQAGATPTMIARDGLHTTNRSSAYEAIAAGEVIAGWFSDDGAVPVAAEDLVSESVQNGDR
jgi:hypothetical protein